MAEATSPRQNAVDVFMEPEEVHPSAFLVCLFRIHDHRRQEGLAWINQMMETIRRRRGFVQLRADKPTLWGVHDGKEHHVEPHHLAPAVFDFTTILLAGFNTNAEVQMWWSSDEVFHVLKSRDCIEKIGIFPVDGLAKGSDMLGMRGFGDRYVLFEFLKMLKFAPVQHYVDEYKRFAASCQKDLGVRCNLLLSEGIGGVLMNEFPLDAVCASTWRSNTESNIWLESDNYTLVLLPTRREFANAFVVLVPIFEDKMEQHLHHKKNPGALTRLR